jgi:PAS domain S-box-containing protein
MRRKIIFSLFALFVFMASGTVIAVLYITSTTSQLKNIIMLHEVEELRRSLIIKIQNVQENLYTVQPASVPDFDFIVSEAMDLNGTVKKCTSCHHEPQLAERIKTVQSLVKDYEISLSYYLTASANSERIAKLKSHSSSIGRKLIKMAEEMSHRATKNLTGLTADTMKQMNRVTTILLITIVITFILGIMVSVNLARSITNPVNELVEATRMIGSGEYGSTIDYKDKTELGELAEHFNSMSLAIKNGYDKIQKEMAVRQDIEEALRASEEKFRTFFKVSPVGILIYPVAPDPFNRRLKYSMFNTAFHTFLGYTSNELNTKTIIDISYPEDIGKDIDLIYELIEGKRDSYSMEKRYRNRKGDIVWGYLNVTALKDRSNTPSQVMTTIVDITARKKMEEEQIKFEKLESVGILAGGIAHDFNNILASIIVNIARAKMSRNSEKLFEILSDVESACNRAKELTNRLITFSKGGTPVKKFISIRDHIKDSTLFALRGSNIKSEFHIPYDLWPVNVDVGQINQVILNLVINAKQAMPNSGTILVKAENIEADAQNDYPLSGRDYIKITFKDNGSGISKDHIKKIFDPYFTTKKKGSGLGLSSAYSIIRNHGGSIDVESVAGSGTTFNVYLPASRDTSTVEPEKTVNRLIGECKILIMDDDTTLRLTLSKTLRQLGYDIELAKDGAEAINLYSKALKNHTPFDAVIMDLTITSGMGGKEAIRKLIEIDPEVKAIVSSGYSDDSLMSNFKQYGFCAIITKPYEIEELHELLNSVIKEKA